MSDLKRYLEGAAEEMVISALSIPSIGMLKSSVGDEYINELEETLNEFRREIKDKRPYSDEFYDVVDKYSNELIDITKKYHGINGDLKTKAKRRRKKLEDIV